MIRSVINLANDTPDHQLNRLLQTVEIRREKREARFGQRRTAFRNQSSSYPQKQIFSPQYKEIIQNALQQNFTLEQLPYLMNQIAQDSPVANKIYGLIGFRKLSLMYSAELVAYFLQNNSIPVLVSTLRNPQKQIIFEGSWIIGNLTSQYQDSGFVKQCLQAGIIKQFITLMSMPEPQNIKIIHNLYMIIGNWSTDRHEIIDQFIEQGGIDFMVKDYYTRKQMYLDKSSENYSEGVIQNFIWSLCNICKSYKKIICYDKVQGVIHVLLEVLPFITNLDPLTDILFTIPHYVKPTNDNIDLFVKYNTIEVFMHWLQEQTISNNLRTVLARNFAIVALGSNQLINHFLENYDPIELIMHLVEFKQSVKVRNEGVWMISNLFATSREIVKNIMRQNKTLMTRLYNRLLDDQINIRKEMAFVFANVSIAFEDPRVYLEYIQKLQIIDIFGQLIRSDIVSIQKGILSAIRTMCCYFYKGNTLCFIHVFKKILERTQCFELIWNFTMSNNTQLQQKADLIMYKYLLKDYEDSNGYESCDEIQGNV